MPPRATARLSLRAFAPDRRTWRYHRHRDDPLFEPTPKPAQRKPKPGQPVSLEALPQLGDAEANEAASIRSEAWWAALADLVKRESVSSEVPEASPGREWNVQNKLHCGERGSLSGSSPAP